jgi:hypothetical protein
MPVRCTWTSDGIYPPGTIFCLKWDPTECFMVLHHKKGATMKVFSFVDKTTERFQFKIIGNVNGGFYTDYVLL